MSFNDITRKFLIGEWKKKKVSALSRARSIRETLESLKVRTIKERQRIEVALENLSHFRREYRKLEEQNNFLTEENLKLNEKLTLLEENKED
jgi:CYTH domain-containing protein